MSVRDRAARGRPGRPGRRGPAAREAATACAAAATPARRGRPAGRSPCGRSRHRPRSGRVRRAFEEAAVPEVAAGHDVDGGAEGLRVAPIEHRILARPDRQVQMGHEAGREARPPTARRFPWRNRAGRVISAKETNATAHTAMKVWLVAPRPATRRREEQPGAGLIRRAPVRRERGHRHEGAFSAYTLWTLASAERRAEGENGAESGAAGTLWAARGPGGTAPRRRARRRRRRTGSCGMRWIRRARARSTACPAGRRAGSPRDAGCRGPPPP
jgi:hypothetical protein